ncbi:hypothetical protein L2Y90_26795 [Burkholderia pyrrocinia]|uniref:hypothetical protein n=1 Tax=Burkholderia pyrrocinia TaxID=60550 RepID=UPI001B9313EC|nr:hypothetical protein [Burkholderia pyrrocinia]MBR8443037.1 hypothetical protein [Burkholderia cenocepacia]UVE67733.1 hypothetical protein L2Y90_26795 [Burkholderia pyrrocinia]
MLLSAQAQSIHGVITVALRPAPPWSANLRIDIGRLRIHESRVCIERIDGGGDRRISFHACQRGLLLLERELLLGQRRLYG